MTIIRGWQVITGWWLFLERLGGGAFIFQDLDLGAAAGGLPEAKLRPTEGGGKHLPAAPAAAAQAGPPEAKFFGESSA